DPGSRRRPQARRCHRRDRFAGCPAQDKPFRPARLPGNGLSLPGYRSAPGVSRSDQSPGATDARDADQGITLSTCAQSGLVSPQPGSIPPPGWGASWARPASLSGPAVLPGLTDRQTAPLTATTPFLLDRLADQIDNQTIPPHWRSSPTEYDGTARDK